MSSLRYMAPLSLICCIKICMHYSYSYTVRSTQGTVARRGRLEDFGLATGTVPGCYGLLLLFQGKRVVNLAMLMKSEIEIFSGNYKGYPSHYIISLTILSWYFY